MILLSFDTEEFDVPREYGIDYSLKEGIEVSIIGTEKILDCLKAHKVKATFFCTSNFAEHAPQTLQRIKDEGHEIAAHGCDHWNPISSDVNNSKRILEKLTGINIRGYRQPRMFPVCNSEVAACGYIYNSSINPAMIPGRYMNCFVKRTYHMKDGVLQIPASVTPFMRFPLFWLSYHLLPAAFYRVIANYVLNYDKYFVTYFHPWEFYPLNDLPHLNLPYIIRKNSGEEMIKRLNDLISEFKKNNHRFLTYTEFAINKIEELSEKTNL